MKPTKTPNPFVIHGYSTPDTFCDRQAETDKLLRAIENGRNVTLLAERRIGKTGLVCHLFHRLRETGSTPCILVDIFATQNLQEFTKCLASAVVGSMDTNLDKAIQAATGFFKSFRPSLSVDAATGTPTLSFGLQSLPAESTLKECFAYLAKKGKCVVALDEFQQVAEFPERGTEALLRSHIQFLQKTRFVFAGSRRHLMAEIFSAPKRPFYNSTQMFPLGVIDRKVYCAFAERHMKSAGVALSSDVFNRVYDLFDGVTWYVQAVMNRLYSFRSASAQDVARAVDRLVAENAYNFGNLLETLPPGSVRLLKAIAAEGKVRELTAGAFMARHGLHANSSVKISLVKLMDAGLVSRDDGGRYLVDDRLFGIWLARQGR